MNRFREKFKCWFSAQKWLIYHILSIVSISLKIQTLTFKSSKKKSSNVLILGPTEPHILNFGRYKNLSKKGLRHFFCSYWTLTWENNPEKTLLEWDRRTEFNRNGPLVESGVQKYSVRNWFGNPLSHLSEKGTEYKLWVMIRIKV